MPVTYPARFKDRFGKEQTSIHNDGNTLAITVRGVEFEGCDFDSLEPKDKPDPEKLSSFMFVRESLCSCVIEADISIPVITPNGMMGGLLEVELELGSALPTGQIDRECLKLQSNFDGQSYSSKGSSGWFDDEMLDIQSQLSPGTLMKACINCAFSDRFPAGHGLFGALACFWGNMAGYRGVSCKQDLFAVWATMAEFVQETHLCPEFERRAPGTGYRG